MAILEIALFFIGMLLIISGSLAVGGLIDRFYQRVGGWRFHLGVPLVALTAALPELTISLMAQWRGMGVVAGAVPIGSAMINVLFLCGLAAAISRTDGQTRYPKLGFLTLILAAGLLLGVGNIPSRLADTASWQLSTVGLTISRWGALTLILAYFLISLATVKSSRQPTPRKGECAEAENAPQKLGWRGYLRAGLGFIFVIAGAGLVSRGALLLLQRTTMSQEMLGLFLLAPIAALPELSILLQTRWLGQKPHYFSEFVNSATANLLLVIGCVSLVAPLPLYPNARIDLLFLTAGALLCLATIYIGRGRRISRGEGILLMLGYVAFAIYAAVRQPEVANVFF